MSYFPWIVFRDRDARWGFALLHSYGWKWDEEKLVMRAPSGKICPSIQLRYLVNKDKALSVLASGGTPWET